MKKYIVKKIDETLILCDGNTQIGKISPEATWVKEGDEIDEFDYRYKDRYGWDVVRDITKISPIHRPKYVIGVKGSCGHFH